PLHRRSARVLRRGPRAHGAAAHVVGPARPARALPRRSSAGPVVGAVKITSVRAIPLAIPVREELPPSPWTPGIAKQVLVRIDTDGGLTGWGEAFAYGAPLAVCNVVDETLAPVLVGEDAT